MTKKGTKKPANKKVVAKTSTKSTKKTVSKKPVKNDKLYLCTSKGVILGEVKEVKQLLESNTQYRVFYLVEK